MGFWVEKRKKRGYRLRFSKPTVVRFAQKRPTNVYEFRYERVDGTHRTITCPVGWGNFSRGRQKDAFDLAERRLSEQYGDLCLAAEAKKREVEPGWIDPTAETIRNQPELHQDNYELVSVVKL